VLRPHQVNDLHAYCITATTRFTDSRRLSHQNVRPGAALLLNQLGNLVSDARTTSAADLTPRIRPDRNTI
jgi:hypothetical protein